MFPGDHKDSPFDTVTTPELPCLRHSWRKHFKSLSASDLCSWNGGFKQMLRGHYVHCVSPSSWLRNSPRADWSDFVASVSSCGVALARRFALPIAETSN